MTLVQERELLERAQSTAEGFGELFDAYYQRIYAYAYRRVQRQDVAEDIAACTFEDALRGIRRMQWRGKPALAWLYRIASRRVADHYREIKNTVELDPELVAFVPDGKGLIEQVDRLAMVQAALARLAASDREIIRLVYLDEVETADIATMLNCSANNVYVRLHRALKRLKAVLDEDVVDGTPSKVVG